jgi:hypothetical protein
VALINSVACATIQYDCPNFISKCPVFDAESDFYGSTPLTAVSAILYARRALAFPEVERHCGFAGQRPGSSRFGGCLAAARYRKWFPCRIGTGEANCELRTENLTVENGGDPVYR